MPRRLSNRTVGFSVGWAAVAASVVLATQLTAPGPALAAASVITKGDLAVSLPSGVDEFTPAGVFVQHLITNADGLAYPTGSAFDGNGNLYVTDFSNNQILKRDAITGSVSVFASNATLGNGQVFNAPESIVFNKGYTRMYVSGANRNGPGGGINIIDTATGVGVGYYSLPSSQGSEGAGESDWLAFDANSNLYMTNENPAQGVMRVDGATGDIVQPSLISNLPNDGYAISFDKNGNLWVGDTNSILEYSTSGALLRTISNPNFSLVFAAVFNSSGDEFYGGDLGNGMVFTYDLSGNLVGSFNAGASVSGLSVSGAVVPPNKPGLQNLRIHDVVVDNTDASLITGKIGGREPSIAVNPANPSEIAILGFSGSWAANHKSNATVWYSQNGGSTWTREQTIPGPTNVPTNGCGPCDQTLDYDRSGRLYGTFLNLTPSGTNVYTGSTSDPARASSWTWAGKPAAVTNLKSKSPDQPWLVTGPDPTDPRHDSVTVAYQDDAGLHARVATLSANAAPTVLRDAVAGDFVKGKCYNPGLRLAADKTSGTRYALWEAVKCGRQPVDTTYYLSRSTDGKTWSRPATVAHVRSTYGGFSFGGVNDLQGGIDALAVDPLTGDVIVAYAKDTDGEGVSNGIETRRVHWVNSGVTIGPERRVSDNLQLALPAVAVSANGTIGLLYDGFQFNSATGRQQFRAIVAVSTDQGATYQETTLAWFDSPCNSTNKTCLNDVSGRVWGDYQQLKSNQNTFYGVFAGNRNAFAKNGRSITDPIFFSFDA